jgi:hypothetical protein
MQTLKPTSVNPQKLSRSEFNSKQAAYDKYVVQKAAYDADKAEYDARWNKWNELSGGQISKYDFEAAPKDPGKPSISDVKPSRGVLKPKNTEVKRPDFVAPGVEKKTKTKTSTSSALTGGGDGLVKAKNPKGGLGSARVINTEKVSRDKIGYNRKKNQFEAYAGTSVLGESHIGKSAYDINAYKKDMKSQRAAYRKEGNLEGIAATSREIKQARKAERFAKGKQTHFNDENYRATTGKTSRIAPDFRNSAQNAANRNTMQSKLDAISAKPKNKTNLY